MSTPPPGSTAHVPAGTAPLLSWQQDGAAAAPHGTPVPGSTSLVPADTVPPLWFSFGAAGPVPSAPVRTAPPAPVATGAAPSGARLPATGLAAPVPAAVLLGVAWVLRRRLAGGRE